FFFACRRRHTISKRDCSSDVCSSYLSDNPVNFTFINCQRDIIYSFNSMLFGLVFFNHVFNFNHANQLLSLQNKKRLSYPYHEKALKNIIFKLISQNNNILQDLASSFYRRGCRTSKGLSLSHS